MQNFEFMSVRQKFSVSKDGQELFIKSQYDWKYKVKDRVVIEICSKFVFRKIVPKCIVLNNCLSVCHINP